MVDWVSGSTGPPELDLGHCRLNLAILFSVAVAEEFRLRYTQQAERIPDPRWDAIALLRYLPGWGSFIQVQAGRQVQVDLAGMHGRVDELLAKTIRRL